MSSSKQGLEFKAEIWVSTRFTLIGGVSPLVMTSEPLSLAGGIITMGGMMNGYFGSFGPGLGLVGLLINIAIIVGVLVLVVWIVRQFNHTTNQANSTNNRNRSGSTLTAREILDIRYARGELSREEYQTMLNDMS